MGSPTESTRKKLPSRGPWPLILGFLAAASLALGAYFVDMSAATNYGFAEFIGLAGGIAFLLEGTVVAVFVPAFLRPIVWTSQCLEVPKGYKTIRVLVDEIAGLGLLYRKQQAGTRTPSGWAAYVFKEDGSAVRLGGAFFAPNRVIKAGDPAKRARRAVFKGTEDELASVDSATLRESKPGRLVQELWDLVVGVQGTNGKLATMQMQKHSHWSRWGTVSSFWSPDGTMGAVAKDGSTY